MSEKIPNLRLEKISGQIEKISPSRKEKEEILRLSPEEKAEQLWSFWNDYRRAKHKLLLEEKKSPRERRRKIEEMENLPELVVLSERIAALWQDKRVQNLFKKHLQENVEQRVRISPDLETYHQREKELESAEANYEELLQDLFVHRTKEPDELTQIEISESSVKADILKDGLEKDFQKNPELASFIQYEKLRDYHRQFEERGFIWTPSRQELFKKILVHLVLLDKNRPMLLVGETGTGKTCLTRAAVERLTDREAFEIGEEAKSDIRPLLGSPSIEEGKTFISYGPLGQALTGKITSRQEESDGGGIFYMDEMNGYPPDALRSLLKQVSGRVPGEKITFAAWRGVWEKIAEKSGIIGAANLPSEKHPDRAELPVEIIRELTTLEVNYPEQRKENPELYEMMLASLMDKNGRIRLKIGELEPEWKEVVEAKTKEKTKELDPDPKSGGTLWRFANLVGDIQKSYKGQENVLTPSKAGQSYLERAVLDPGIVLSWLREYRLSHLRKGKSLKIFLQEKIKNWSEQKTYSKEDRDLLKEFFAAYDLPIEGQEAKKSDIKGEKIWSEKEIGFLSPRVPRPKERIEAPKPLFSTAFLEDGTEIEYQAAKKPERFAAKGKSMSFVGTTAKGEIVLEDEDSKTVKIIGEKEFDDVKNESYLEETRKQLEMLGPDDLERRTNQIIDYLVQLVPSKEQVKYRKQLEKQLKGLSEKEKIEYILSQLV